MIYRGFVNVLFYFVSIRIKLCVDNLSISLPNSLFTAIGNIMNNRGAQYILWFTYVSFQDK